MGTEIKVWQLKGGELHEIEEDDLAAAHYEKELEEWIERDTSLLGSKLLVIGRQHDVPDVGCLDLLCIDEAGALVVIEFKRSHTSRETVAQILDYASWLDGASEEEVEACALNYLDKPLSEAFSEFFGSDLQSLTPQNHRMLVVAPKLDSSAERIINYLAERHGIKINAVFFRYAKTAQGEEILVRTVLVPDIARSSDSGRTVTAADLMAVANDLKIIKLVETCRKFSAVAEERARRTYGGSFRYWLKDKMIFGVNVAGGRRKPPPGELDVWIPVPSLSGITGVPDQEIRKVLKQDFTTTESGMTDCIIRLKSSDEAQALVSRVRGWVTGNVTSIEKPVAVKGLRHELRCKTILIA